MCTISCSFLQRYDMDKKGRVGWLHVRKRAFEIKVGQCELSLSMLS
jgi:hypothetical protein